VLDVARALPAQLTGPGSLWNAINDLYDLSSLK